MQFVEALERNSAARFTLYANDITLCRPGIEYPEEMLTELPTAVLNPHLHLRLQLAPEEMELLTVYGRKPLPRYNTVTKSLSCSDVTSTLQPMRLLGIPIGHRNSLLLWLKHLKAQQNSSHHPTSRAAQPRSLLS